MDPPPSIQNLSTQSLLSYLHFKHQSSQVMSSLRVVIVGPEKVGKSTLIARLKGDSSTDIPLTKGLEVRCNIVRPFTHKFNPYRSQNGDIKETY